MDHPAVLEKSFALPPFGGIGAAILVRLRRIEPKSFF
jgi:hypothetical protein